MVILTNFTFGEKFTIEQFDVSECIPVSTNFYFNCHVFMLIWCIAIQHLRNFTFSAKKTQLKLKVFVVKYRYVLCKFCASSQSVILDQSHTYQAYGNAISIAVLSTGALLRSSRNITTADHIGSLNRSWRRE